MARAALQDGSETASTNSLDPLLGYQLRRASAAILADLNRCLADLELRSADASVIILIDDNPGITQSELGRALGIQRANMTPLAAALIDRGLISRGPANGRSQALRLSGEGCALAKLVRARIAAHEAGFLADLAPNERAALIGLLRTVWAAEPPGPSASAHEEARS